MMILPLWRDCIFDYISSYIIYVNSDYFKFDKRGLCYNNKTCEASWEGVKIGVAKFGGKFLNRN
jgi:hypothetical protein